MDYKSMESAIVQAHVAQRKHTLLGGLLCAVLLAVFSVVLIGEFSSSHALRPIYAVREYPEITIKSIFNNERRKGITVPLPKGGGYSLDVGPKTWIIKDNSPGTFDDLEVGQLVRVWYIPRGAQAVIIQVLRPDGQHVTARSLSAGSDATPQNPSVVRHRRYGSKCTETNNKQTLVDTFRKLVHLQLHVNNKRLLRKELLMTGWPLTRRVALQTQHDEKNLGIDKRNFSVQVFDECLASPVNANVADGKGNSPIGSLLENARQKPVTFYFYWAPAGSPEECNSAFSIRFHKIKAQGRRGGLVEVRLLFLRFPENVPIRVGLAAATKSTLKENDLDLERLRVMQNGCMYPMFLRRNDPGLH